MDVVKSAISYLTFQRFYRYLLKRVLGKIIVPDFSLDQLDVELYKGVVQLTDVVVNASTLNAILRSEGTPVVIKSGTMSKLRIRVPWRNILHDTCKLYVSELELNVAVATPSWIGSFSSSTDGTDAKPSPSSSDVSSTVRAMTRLVEQVLMNVEVCVEKIIVNVEGEHGIRFETSNILVESNSVVSKQCRIGETEIHLFSSTAKSRLLRLSPVTININVDSPDVISVAMETENINLAVDRKRTLSSIIELAERWKRIYAISKDDSCMYQSVIEGDVPSSTSDANERPWYEEIYAVIEKEVAKESAADMPEPPSMLEEQFVDIPLDQSPQERRVCFDLSVGTLSLSLFERERDAPSTSVFLRGIRACKSGISVEDYAVNFIPVRLSSDAIDMFVSMMSHGEHLDERESSVYESVGDEEDSFADSVVGDGSSDPGDSPRSDSPAITTNLESNVYAKREALFFSDKGASGLRQLDDEEYARGYHPSEPEGTPIIRPGILDGSKAIQVNFSDGSIDVTVEGGITISLTPEYIANWSILSQAVSVCIDDVENYSIPIKNRDPSRIHISVPDGISAVVELGNGHAIRLVSRGEISFDSVDGGRIPTLAVVTAEAVTAAEIDAIQFWFERDQRMVVEEPTVAMTASVHSSKSAHSSDSRRSGEDRFGSSWTAVASKKEREGKKDKVKSQSLPGTAKPAVTEKSLAEASAETVTDRCNQRSLTEIIFCANSLKICENAIHFLDLQLKIQSLVDQISLTTVALHESLGIRGGPGLLTPRSLLASAIRPAVGITIFLSNVSVHAIRLNDVAVRTVMVSGQPLMKVSVRHCQAITAEGATVCEPWTKVAPRVNFDTKICYDSVVLPRFARCSNDDVVTVTVQVNSIPGEEQTTSRICLGITLSGLRIEFDPSLIDFFKTISSFFAPPVALVNHAAPLITAPPRPTYTVYIFRLNRSVVEWKSIPSPVAGTEGLVAAAALILDGIETSSGVLSTVDKNTPAGLSISLGNISCWLAKKVWADAKVQRVDITKSLAEMGYVQVAAISNASGSYKWKGREQRSLAFNLGLLRCDFRADTYAGVGYFAKSCESVIDSLKPVSENEEEETISMPPLAQPVAAKFTIREDFVQSKTVLRSGRGGSRWSRPAAQPQPPPETMSDMGARWLVDPKQVAVVHDHWSWVGMSGNQTRESVAKAAESRVKTSNGLLAMLSVSLTVDQVRLFMHGGFDWEGTEFHLAGLLRRRKRKSASVIQPQSLVCVELDNAVLSLLTVKARSAKLLSQVRPDELTTDLSISISEARIKDGVVGSVYQYVVRANNTGGHVSLSYSSVGTVRKGQITVQPLCITLDQDTLEFMSKFVQQTTLLAYRGDETVELDLSMDEEEEDVNETHEHEEIARQVSEPLSTEETVSNSEVSDDIARRQRGADIDVLFQSLIVSPIQVEVNYRSKRLSISGLRRGDPLQLLNLVPVLEGLQVALSEIKMVDVVDKADVVGRLTRSWSKDINKAQILRSLSGVTPIRSFTNLSLGVSDLIKQPLKQIRRKDGHLSRGVLRGISSFLRTLTIESLNLADVVVSSAQNALEFVDNIASTREATPSLEEVECVWDDSDGADSTAGETPAEEWTAVERGARERLMDPPSAIEGLKSGGDVLLRGLKSGFQQSPRGENSGVIVSMAKGAPGFILRPAIGAAQAVSVVLRGARSTVDSGRQRAVVERRYKAPYTQEDLMR